VGGWKGVPPIWGEGLKKGGGGGPTTGGRRGVKRGPRPNSAYQRDLNTHTANMAAKKVGWAIRIFVIKFI
jgi:hypothetical protein